MFLIGLAVVLGLLFGVAATVLAGTGVGATFNLGQANTVDKISSLIGSATSAMLKIDNDGAGPALALQVEPGRQPMTVNSERKVARHNADKLDGLHSTSFAGSGNSVYTGSKTICDSPQVSSITFSVPKASRVYASAHADVVANGNAGADVIMNIELRNSTNTTTLAQSGFGARTYSAGAVDVRSLDVEGVLKSNISTPSEAHFVATPATITFCGSPVASTAAPAQAPLRTYGTAA